MMMLQNAVPQVTSLMFINEPLVLYFRFEEVEIGQEASKPDFITSALKSPRTRLWGLCKHVMSTGQPLDYWVLARLPEMYPKGEIQAGPWLKILGEILRDSQWICQQEFGTSLCLISRFVFDLFRQRQPVAICCYSHRSFHRAVSGKPCWPDSASAQGGGFFSLSAP